MPLPAPAKIGRRVTVADAVQIFGKFTAGQIGGDLAADKLLKLVPENPADLIHGPKLRNVRVG